MAVRVRRSDMRQRLQLFSICVAGLYVLLIARLVYLQAFQAPYYREKARIMRARTIPLEAQRGAITDREGRPLALTTHSATLVCDPVLVKDPVRAATALSEVLGTPAGDLVPLLMKSTTPKGYPVRCKEIQRGLTPEMVGAFQAAIGSRGLKAALSGIEIHDKAERTYPAGADTGHPVGFTVLGKKAIPEGKAGLELSLEKALRGEPGFVSAELDARRRIIPYTQSERVEAADGYDVRLTLDSAIQHMVQTELKACCDQYNPVGATAIVLDVRTGDVLAMVSWPELNPVKRPKLTDKRGVEAYRNRALSLYEPGSTLKAITIATALQEGVVSPTETFVCNGSLTIGNRHIRCVLHGSKEKGGHGALTVRQIIEHSCNVGTAQVAMRLGMARMAKGLASFGLLSPTGVGLPADSRGRLGFGMEATKGGIGKVSRVGFGQSVLVSPLGLAEAYTAIANGGSLMRARLVQGYYDANGRLVRAVAPQKVHQAVSPQVAAQLRSYLRQVVVSGTGKAAAVPGYTVAGKTGTAQKVVPGQAGYASGRYVASFIGFLPVEAPRALVFVVVDEPQGSYYGAQVAAPVFKSIAQKLMWYWKVPPDDPASLASAPKPAGGETEVDQ